MEAFSAFDTNGDGRLSLAELTQIISQVDHHLKLAPASATTASSGRQGAVLAAARQLMARLDCDGDGSLSLAEFSAHVVGTAGLRSS